MLEFRKTTDGYQVWVNGKILGFISKDGFLVSTVFQDFVYMNAAALQKLADVVKMVTRKHPNARWDLEDFDEDNSQELVKTCPDCRKIVATD